MHLKRIMNEFNEILTYLSIASVSARVLERLSIYLYDGNLHSYLNLMGNEWLAHAGKGYLTSNISKYLIDNLTDIEGRAMKYGLSTSFSVLSAFSYELIQHYMQNTILSGSPSVEDALRDFIGIGLFLIGKIYSERDECMIQKIFWRLKEKSYIYFLEYFSQSLFILTFSTQNYSFLFPVFPFYFSHFKKKKNSLN